jgi:hypothetical protein
MICKYCKRHMLKKWKTKKGCILCDSTFYNKGDTNESKTINKKITKM